MISSTVHISDERDIPRHRRRDKESTPVSGWQRTVPGTQCRHTLRHRPGGSLQTPPGEGCRSYAARQPAADLTLPAAGRRTLPARVDKQIHRELSQKNSPTAKGSTKKWHSEASTSSHPPCSAIWKTASGRASSLSSPSTCPYARQPAYKAIRFKARCCR